MSARPVVLDLDGTLIDSAPDIHAAVNGTLREFGLHPLPIDRVRSFIGGGVEVLWHRIIRFMHLHPNGERELIAAFMKRYHDATALTKLYPAAEAALVALHEAGHPLGLCTNKPLAPTRAILDHFGIAQAFSAVIAGDNETGLKKPHPEPLLACLAALECTDPAAALYIGDSEIDGQTAAAAGVPFLLYTRGYRLLPLDEIRHVASFDDFAALPALVAAHSA